MRQLVEYRMSEMEKKMERNYVCIYFYCKSRIKDNMKIGKYV